ncbi:hypothetical protein O997_04040 [Anaplasma phagocytophilum str. MRK]|nr:hypothetical protein O997_04040 [Anaplasma phagocytophilum str. MRK]
MRVRSVATGFSCYNLAAVLCRRRSSLVFFPKDNVLECPGEPQGSCGICVGCCINTTFEAVLV